MPVEAQLFVTAALRNLSACSAGLVLYRASVPKEDPWHSTFLASFFSFSIWKHIAAISFCSYLVHFRLLMEIIYSVTMQTIFGIKFPAIATTGEESVDALVTEWIFVMLKVFAVGICISFFVAKVLHEMVEKPAAIIIEKFIFPRKSSSEKNKKKV